MSQDVLTYRWGADSLLLPALALYFWPAELPASGQNVPWEPDVHLMLSPGSFVMHSDPQLHGGFDLPKDQNPGLLDLGAASHAIRSQRIIQLEIWGDGSESVRICCTCMRT